MRKEQRKWSSESWCGWSLLVLLAGAWLGVAAAAGGGAGDRPVRVSGVDLNQLAGEVVCIYNFSSW